MANANAEAQRRWRERQKQKKLDGLKQASAVTDAGLFRTPFFEHYEKNDNSQSVEICLDIAGIEPVQFYDDAGPKTFTGQIERDFERDGQEFFRGASNSLARAEVIVGSLIDAAAELASIIKTYKRKEIVQRIAEIETSDLTDPVKRKSALAQIVRLNKLLDQLSKQVRWTFEQWKTDES